MKITRETRKKIVDFLLTRQEAFYGELDLISFLKRIWDLSSMNSTDRRFKTAEGDIWQHMINNDDWTFDYLLNTYLDLPACNDDVFIRFIFECINPLVVPDESSQRELLETFNYFLKEDGYIINRTKTVVGRRQYSNYRLEAINDMQTSIGKGEYEVVLSFAGEDREYVEKVAEYLKNNDVKVFYDRYERVSLWGKDLAEHLDKVYRGSARYCVMFISKYYGEKIWTNHERRSALAKAIEQKEEYILPVRFDETEIPGIRSTIGYVDIKDVKPEELGEMIIEKLGKVQTARTYIS